LKRANSSRASLHCWLPPGIRPQQQEVLTLLPANERDAIQPEIVAAQLRSGEFAAALELRPRYRQKMYRQRLFC